jgi:RimJ/RimL family protein N-acetyltransferase
LTIRVNDAHRRRKREGPRNVTKSERIETTRLLLEPLTLEQGDAFSRGDREAQPWAPGFPTDGDLRQAHILANNPARAVSPVNAWGPYTLIEKLTGLCIGGIGFKGRPDASGAVEIGYGVCAQRQGQGLMTEAASRLCVLAREEGALSVTAETDAANIASQRVLEKCGFDQTFNDDASIQWRLDLDGVTTGA